MKILKETNIIVDELKQLKYNDKWILNEHKETIPIKSNIMDKLEAQSGIDLRGLHIDTPLDVAILAKIFRDTRFEIFRILYVNNNNEIVGSDAITYKLPNTTPTYFKHSKSTTEDENIAHSWIYYQNKMQKLNATKFYLLHNHTSGKLSPSINDFNVTQVFINKLNNFEFLGHIILGIDGFTILEPNFNYNTGEGILSYTYDEDEVNQNKTQLKTPIEINKFIKNLNIDNTNHFTAIYLNNDQYIVNIEHCNNKAVNDKNFLSYLKNQKRNFGATDLFIYTENSDFDFLSKYFYEGFISRIINNIIITKGNNVFTFSELLNLSYNELQSLFKKANTTNNIYKLYELD